MTHLIRSAHKPSKWAGASRKAFANAKPLLTKADAMRNEKRYAEAAQLYERALAWIPGNASIHVQCGHMNKEIGRLSLAEAHYRVAQFLTPEDADLNLQLGHFYKVSGRMAEAVTFYRHAASIRPNWTDPLTELSNLGVTDDQDSAATLGGQQSTSSYLEMITHFRRLMVRLLPSSEGSHPWRLVRLAPLLASNSQTEDVVRFDSETLRLAEAADEMSELGRLKDAADLYEAALLGQAGYPDLHLQCGHMNRRIGRLDLAYKHYLAAKAQAPDGRNDFAQIDVVLEDLRHTIASKTSSDKIAISYSDSDRLSDQSHVQVDQPGSELTSARINGLNASTEFLRNNYASSYSLQLQVANGHGLTVGNRPEDLFDVRFYRQNYPEVDVPDKELLNDYLEAGWIAGRNPNAMFDGRFYFDTYKDAAATNLNPLLHFILFGQFERKNPFPIFDTNYYLSANPDVLASRFNPLFHFLSGGMQEGRSPHPLFDIKYYRSKYKDKIKKTENLVEHYLKRGAYLGYNPNPLFFSTWYSSRMDRNINPLVHYILYGVSDVKSPNPLFDSRFYLKCNTDVRDAQMDPLTHYMTGGWRERRNPHPLFNTEHYLAHNPSLEGQGINPLAHYLEEGYQQDRSPSMVFDPIYYRSICPAAQPKTVNPLIHYVEYGAAQGFEASQDAWITSLLDDRDDADLAAAITPEVYTRTQQIVDILHPPGRAPQFTPGHPVIPLCAPLNIHAVPSGKSPPRLNILLPVAGMSSTSGGPNTVLNLGYRLAVKGIPIRIISTDGPPDSDPGPYIDHARKLSGMPPDRPVDIILADGSNRSQVLYIGEEDQFLASAWWTAQMIKSAVRQTRSKRFFYMVQDYEPLLHESSTLSALAEQTYSLDMIPIINTELLSDFLKSGKIGRFGDPEFSDRALVFDPAVDRDHFYHVQHDPLRKRQLLFYARPITGRRNLFEIGVAVLRKLIADGVVSSREWDFIGMGEQFAPVDLGGGAVLAPAPWLSFADYAELMRGGSILLSLMLSPHPSYPPIEMAACGQFAVTTEFGNKTAAALRAISPYIIAVPPTVEALAAAVAIAVSRLDTNQGPPADITYHANWEQSLAPVVDEVLARLLGQMGSPMVDGGNGREIPAVGFRHWPTYPLALAKYEHQRRRGAKYDDPEPGLISFVTTVWNTDPKFFGPLIESVLTQDCQGFEWILLDNGSVRKDTLELIEQLKQHSNVHVYRVEENIGIIKGMRYVLERAHNRYIAPLDSDDLLTPDCVRVITTFLRREGYPKIAYTDEDRMIGDTYLEPYCKPAWDPVLFFHSCYIAHLGCIDRALALELDAYSDSDTNGSHDWDTFTRFYVAGYQPAHIPEILYSWRLHEQSTAANIDSKSYITSSHEKVLGRLIESRPDPESYHLVRSPLFKSAVDWRFTRDIPADLKLVSIVIGPDCDDGADAIHLESPVDWRRLAEIASAAGEGALVHLAASGLVAGERSWLLEAYTLMGLFPDIVVVGGYIYRDGRMVAADTFFDINDGVRSPNQNRLTADPGYFAQAWKPHSCDAVPAQHCVVDAALLAATAERLAGTCATFEGLGLWLGRIAAEQSKRVVYSPFFSASFPAEYRVGPSRDERRAQMLIQSEQDGGSKWPPALGRTPTSVYQRIYEQDAKREAAALKLLANYALASVPAAMLARKFMSQAITQPRTISVLTSVWQKTDAQLFEATVQSVLEQTIPLTEWVILRNGPVPADVAMLLQSLATDSRINVQSLDRNVGIMGAVRFCLEQAHGDIVIPMDADDLLVPDAFETLLQTFTNKDADLIFSDEDILQGDRIVACIQRRAFDPILNMDDSYIWHLCAFDRRKALALGVYSEGQAEFCHDWDTVTRFAAAGCRIEHIPHVLYHWRVHQRSSSNSGDLNIGSLKSVEFVLQRTINRQVDPALYEVAPFPISRGVEQLAILRRPIKPLSSTLILLSTGAFGEPIISPFLPVPEHGNTKTIVVKDAFGSDGTVRLKQALQGIQTDIVCILAEGCVPEPQGVWEAMRLFELHQDVSLVGGRLYRADGIVVDACATTPGAETPNSWIGRSLTDPGEAALALKPQTAYTVPSFYFYGRTRLLQQLVPSLQETTSLLDIGRAIAEACRDLAGRIAYSPLVQGRVVADPRMIMDPFGEALLGLPPPISPAASPYYGIDAGTIISPVDWGSVGQKPTIVVAADFRGKLTVRISPLVSHKARRNTPAIPLRLHKDSVTSPIFTATPIDPLPFGQYLAEVIGGDGKALNAIGLIVGEEPERKKEILQEIVTWRNDKIPVAACPDTNPTAPLFSVTSTVYDTPILFLRELAENLISQTWADFEWVVLDNGCKNPAIIEYISRLPEQDGRIRVFRVEENIHIIPGNRYLLERSVGRYVVPVDSDDIVYGDALERIASYAQHLGYPDLLYTDEVKVDISGELKNYIWRSEPSVLFSLSTCPASHLMAFDRELAIRAGVYSDSYAKGSHDWDTYLRLIDQGAKPVRVPEVLYGWRMHEASSAMSSNAKDYLINSQIDVVRHSLVRRGLHSFTAEHATGHEVGYYHVRWNPQTLPEVLLKIVVRHDEPDAANRVAHIAASFDYEPVRIEIFVPRSSLLLRTLQKARPEKIREYDDPAELGTTLLNKADSAEFTFVIDSLLEFTNRDWLRDSVATFEIDPSVGIVGGLILGEDRMMFHCGYVAGLNGFLESPYLNEYGDHAWNAIRRTITATYGGLLGVRNAVVKKIGGLAGIDGDTGLYGVEFSLRANRAGFTTAFCPSLSTIRPDPLLPLRSGNAKLQEHIAETYKDLLVSDPYYTSRWSQTSLSGSHQSGL